MIHILHQTGQHSETEWTHNHSVWYNPSAPGMRDVRPPTPRVWVIRTCQLLWACTAQHKDMLILAKEESQPTIRPLFFSCTAQEIDENRSTRRKTLEVQGGSTAGIQLTWYVTPDFTEAWDKCANHLHQLCYLIRSTYRSTYKSDSVLYLHV